MAPLWQKVYDANYHKSLDHRSFYFKQTDKRLLGAKGMVADIRGAFSTLTLIVITLHYCTVSAAPEETPISPVSSPRCVPIAPEFSASEPAMCVLRISAAAVPGAHDPYKLERDS